MNYTVQKAAIDPPCEAFSACWKVLSRQRDRERARKEEKRKRRKGEGEEEEEETSRRVTSPRWETRARLLKLNFRPGSSLPVRAPPAETL